MWGRTLCYVVLAGGALGLGALLGRFLVGDGDEVKETMVPEAVAQGVGELTAEELQGFSPFPVFWLGEEYRGLTVTNISYVRDPGPPDGRRPPVESVTIIYGDCDPGPPELGEGGCVPPLQVTTDRFCLNRPSWLAPEARRGPPIPVRGAYGQQTASGNLHVYMGESTVVIFSTEGDEAALEAANSLRGANGAGLAHASSSAVGLRPPMPEEDCDE